MNEAEPTNNIVADDFGYVEILPPQPKGFRALLKKIKLPLGKFKIFRVPHFRRLPTASFSFKKKPVIIMVAVLVLLILGGVYLFSNSVKSSIKAKSDQKAEIPDAKARQIIARNFDFGIKDASGKEVTKLHYSIENAELHDQIVVQGQRASAVAGKTFLVFNLKITNDYDKPIQLNTKDYIRLTRNGSNEQLAADIHNDPVTIQPISTKYTRLGFAINENDKNLELHVGEINGAKTTIDIKF